MRYYCENCRHVSNFGDFCLNCWSYNMLPMNGANEANEANRKNGKMKIEVVIKHASGDIRRYPVHRLDRIDGEWIARYTTVKGGMHVSKRVKIDGDAVKVEVIP